MNNAHTSSESPERVGIFKRLTNTLSNFLLISLIGSLFALIITVVFKVLIFNALMIAPLPWEIVLTIAEINEFIWFIGAELFSAVAAVQLSKKNIFAEIYDDFFF